MKNFIRSLNLRKKILQSFLLSLSTLIISISIFVLPAQATGVFDLPVIKAQDSIWVVDQSNTLSLTNENRLTTILENLTQNTDYVARMVIIRRLDYGETMDNFADQLFTKWFDHSDQQENQLLLVMDTLTNQTAIRLGEKVKSILTEDTVNSIMSETIAYPLKEGKYNQALLDGSDRIVAILSGKEDPGPPQIKEIKVEGTFTTAEETDDQNATIWVVGFLIVATIVPMLTYWLYVK